MVMRIKYAAGFAAAAVVVVVIVVIVNADVGLRHFRRFDLFFLGSN
jgi:hypothetical protein